MTRIRTPSSVDSVRHTPNPAATFPYSPGHSATNLMSPQPAPYLNQAQLPSNEPPQVRPAAPLYRTFSQQTSNAVVNYTHDQPQLHPNISRKSNQLLSRPGASMPQEVTFSGQDIGSSSASFYPPQQQKLIQQPNQFVPTVTSESIDYLSLGFL